MSDGPVIESIVVKTVAEKDLWAVTLTVWFGPSLFLLEDILKVEFHWNDTNISTFTFPLFIKVGNEQSHNITFTLPKVIDLYYYEFVRLMASYTPIKGRRIGLSIKTYGPILTYKAVLLSSVFI